VGSAVSGRGSARPTAWDGRQALRKDNTGYGLRDGMLRRDESARFKSALELRLMRSIKQRSVRVNR